VGKDGILPHKLSIRRSESSTGQVIDLSNRG